MSEPGPRPGQRRHHAVVTRQPVIGGRPRPAIRSRTRGGSFAGAGMMSMPGSAPEATPIIGVLPREQLIRRRTARSVPAARRPRRVHGLLVLAAVAVVLFLGAGAAGYTVYASSLLRVNVAEVEGATYTSPHEIAGQAALFGESLLTADLAVAAARVREMPLIADARIERRWPRTVRIIVTEREPWGVWEQAGVAYTIDREGIVMGTTIAPPPGAPVIRSSEQGSRIQGERVDIHAVQAAARIWADLPARLGVEVTEVAFLAGMGVQVTTSDGQVALLGDASGIDYKLAAWAAVSDEALRQGIVYRIIDLRFGNRPVLVQ